MDLTPTSPKRKPRPLTPDQQALIDTMVAKDVNHVRAAEILGKCKKWASKTIRKDHVSQALNERTKARLTALANQAVGTVERLLQADDESVQLRAARDILDRTGFRTSESSLTTVVADNVQINIDLG